MAIQLNHTIVHARDVRASAAFFTEIFGLPPAVPFGPFLGVEVHNGVTLDFLETDEPIQAQHYAFLVSDAEWDAIFGRVQARGVDYWADPHLSEKGRFNTYYGGRGVYFMDPARNLLEIITKPYGKTFP